MITKAVVGIYSKMLGLDQVELYIDDIRVGCVAVHINDPEKYHCLDGLSKDCIFYKSGFQVYDEDGRFRHWEVYPEDIITANLIAASPNMYKALKALVDHFRNNDENYWKSDLCTEALEALRKAEGK